MWFRIFLAIWSVALFALVGWLAAHKSLVPSILGRYSPFLVILLLGIAALAMLSLLAQRSFL